VLHDRRELQPSAASRIGGALADQSYTLYVGHVPLLVFCRAWLGNEAGQWQPGGLTLLYACGLTLAALVYAFGVARMTERHTEAWRSRVQSWLWRRPAPVLVPDAAGTDVAAYAVAPRGRVAENS
jgi:peptidoglycan/LPS O-acetylase OafA/YrhL